MKRILPVVILITLRILCPAQQRGLINVSVADMKLSPDYESSTDSQALLGTPVLMLERDGYWNLVETPEGYRGWVTDLQVIPTDPDEFEAWKKAERVIVTEHFTLIRAEAADDSQVISDAIMGDILELGGETGCRRRHCAEAQYLCVGFPDGRSGWIPRDAVTPFREWAASRRADRKGLTSAAEGFTGVQYLWGGLSVKGFDCSGLVKMTYFMNGLILLRNASQQAGTGEEVPVEGTPEELARRLQPGDLIMFANVNPEDPSPRPSHVGISLGGDRFIHSSLMVRTNSILPGRADYYDSKHIIGVRRITGHEGEPGVTRIIDHPWYF